MDFCLYPTKRPTPGEYKVLVFASALLLIVLGGFTFWLGYSAPPEQQAEADKAMRYGAASIGLGGLIVAGYWIVQRIVNS